MGLFGPSKKEVQSELDEQRRKNAERNEFQNNTNVQDYKNDSAADLHRQKQALEKKKNEDIASIGSSVKDKIRELENSATIKKLELINEADKAKVAFLNEQDQRRQQLDKEHREDAEEARKRKAILIKNQDEAIAERDKIQANTSMEAVNQTRQVEDLRNQLNVEQKELSAKINSEFFETEKTSNETRLALTKETIDKEEQNYQMALQQKMDFNKEQHATGVALLNARISQEEITERRKVNMEINKAVSEVQTIKDDAGNISTQLEAVMDLDVQSTVSERLVLIGKQLGTLGSTMNEVEKKCSRLSCARGVIDQVKSIKNMINDTKSCIIGIRRDLKPSKVFDESKREKFDKHIDEIAKSINEIERLEINDNATRQNLAIE